MTVRKKEGEREKRERERENEKERVTYTRTLKVGTWKRSPLVRALSKTYKTRHV